MLFFFFNIVFFFKGVHFFNAILFNVVIFFSGVISIFMGMKTNKSIRFLKSR